LGDRALLIFGVAASWFAIDPEFAQELAAQQRPTKVPRVPHYIPGLVKLRGKAVPLLDLEKFFELPPAADAGRDEEEFRRRVVVVHAKGMTVGLLSDRVRNLVSVPESAFASPDSLPAGRVRDFAQAEIADPTGAMATGGGVIVVLKVDALLEAARVRSSGALA